MPVKRKQKTGNDVVKPKKQSKDVKLTDEILDELLLVISHPLSAVRTRALQKLAEYEDALDFSGKDETIINVLLAVEADPLQFENFRERAALLRKVRYGSVQHYLPKNFTKKFEQLTFRFILAQLFENLTDYWPLVTEIAGSYTKSDILDDLWSSFQDLIERATEHIRETKPPALPKFTDDQLNADVEKICAEAVDARVNFWTNRLELYRLLSAKFVGLSERKNHFLVEAFFDVHGNEFGKSDRKLVKSTMVSMMAIFSKFQNLRSVYRCDEIYELFNQLLRQNDTQLQKAALACIFSFKNKALEPYRQNFDNLVEEKAFRDELLHFSVDEGNTVLDEEHRQHVMPVLLNLLDGKMNTRTSKNIPRRPVIFRFVASCRSEELELFLRTVFWGIRELIDPDDICKTAQNIISSYDPKTTINYSRLTSILDCLDETFKKLIPALNKEQRSYVYQITVACHLLIRLGLEHAETEAHVRKSLRNLRTHAFDLLASLFNAFQRREFTTDEFDILFNECIRPYLPENDPSADVPWSILRFFGKLSEITHFYPLLNVPIFDADDSQTPLSFLCEFLFSALATRENKLVIVEKVLNLLTFFHEDSLIELPNLRQAELQCAVSKDRSLGTCLVINYVPRLLAYLKDAIPHDIQSLSYSSESIHFALLEKISEFTNDPTLGNQFASTLLPFVEAGYLRNDDNLSAVLIAIGNFLQLDQNPVEYLNRVAPFLSTFRSRKTRAALVRLLQSLHSNPHLPAKFKGHLKCLQQLEAWHSQRINEPDYEQRHETMAELAKVYERVDSNALPLVAIRAYIHSHFYSLAYIDEISVRSASSSCLRLLVELLKKSPYFVKHSDEQLQLLDNDFIPVVQRAIKSSNENIRHEAVQLLSTLVDNFADEIEVLRPLKQLRDVEKSDACFFENVTHLQIHRRQRAFIRLSQGLESKEIEIPLQTIDKFITPLIRPYLLQTDNKYLALSDECIRLYAVIVKQQPWATYHRILTYYIDRVNSEDEKNKPIVRVLIAILGAFNFNVSDVNLPQGAAETKEQARQKKLEAIQRQKQRKSKKKQFVSYTSVKATQLSGKAPNLNELNDDEKIKNLTPEQRILATVLRVIIPRLRKCITPPQEFHAHKKAQKGDEYFTDEEEINRTPIAIATVKLLQKLPVWAMDMHLQGVIMTVLHLLLSRSYIVRESARKAMEEIVCLLGPDCLPIVLNDLRQNLTRGYQVHVMIYTVHCMIACLEGRLEPGDLDESFEDIFEVVKEQQFGQIEEERQLAIIKAKTPEAKSNKTTETFILLGRYISADSLDKFIEPMREIIENSPKITTYKKLQELLRALSNGLRRNQGISSECLLQFSGSILNQYIEEMCKQQDALRAQEIQEKQEREAGYRPKHALLLPIEPKRLGAIVKTSSKSKVSIFVEFGLQLLGDVLAEKHYNPEDNGDAARLNPFLAVILNALRLKYEKTTTLALRVLVILLKFPLPSISEKMSALVDRLFVLLAEYANASGTTKMNVNELNQHLFKAVVSVLRQAPDDLLTKRRLQILLNHVETDLLDPHKQASAFVLAKSIIARRLESEKIDDLVKYLAELSVTSPIEQTRQQSRSTIQTYFRVHPSGEASVERWLKFFIEQLDYEFVHGRLSALESINSLFRLFNVDVIDKYGLSTFVRLASRFIEDDDVECHRFAAAAIRELVTSVSDSIRNDIYLAVKDWINSVKAGPRYIGMRALTELVKIQDFVLNNERVKSVLETVINRYFELKSNEKARTDENVDSHEENTIENGEKPVEDDEKPAENDESEDEIEAALNLLVELIRNRLNLVRNSLKKGGKSLQAKLIGGLPHLLTFSPTETVCCAAATLLEHLLASTKSIWPLLSKHADLPELCQRSIRQLCFQEPSTAFAEEAVKNLVTLSVQVDTETFDYLCKRLATLPRKEVRKELSALKRLNSFKFMAAQLVQFNPEDAQFESLIKHLGPVLFRELTGKSSKAAEQLMQMATEVASILRDKIGETEFNALLSNYQMESAKKQAERKRERKELLLVDQQAAAKERQRLTVRKSSAKKRKLDAANPYRVLKRKRRDEIRRTGEIE